MTRDLEAWEMAVLVLGALVFVGTCYWSSRAVRRTQAARRELRLRLAAASDAELKAAIKAAGQDDTKPLHLFGRAPMWERQVNHAYENEPRLHWWR